MHYHTSNAIKRKYFSFNIDEVLIFFESDKNSRQTPHNTMKRIKNFYEKYSYSCYDLTHKDLLRIHEKLCDRFIYITHPSVIDKSLFDILAKTKEDSDLFYDIMCRSKTKSMIEILKTNPDLMKVGDRDALIRRYGEIEGNIKYEKFRETQKLSSKRSINYWLNLGLSDEKAKEELKKAQTTFSLAICIEKYGKEEGTQIWKERQEKWQNTLTSKPQKEIDEMNRKKSNMINSSRYNSNNDVILYLIQLPNDHLKIGITNKNLISDRYTELQLKDCKILYNKKYKGNIANIFELIIKENYSDNILYKEEQLYRQFGYTETIKNISSKLILEFIEELNIIISMIN